MKTIIIMQKDEIDLLSVEIAESIIALSQKFYGFKMVLRDTCKEMSEEEMLGALATPIRRALLESVK